VNHCKSPLEKEIEKLRIELSRGNPLFGAAQDMDRKTYALSLKMDKLIVEYMKSEESQEKDYKSKR
jgi:hypothetical protein